MSITPEELELAQKAAQMSSAILPRLKREQAELADRIKWHEANIAAWAAMQGKPITEGLPANPFLRPAQSSFVVNGVTVKSGRAARGAAQDRILAIMQEHPEYKAKDINKEIERQTGLAYPLSTIYRVMELVKDKSKTPA